MYPLQTVSAPFAWSWSSYATWRECRRRYWLQTRGAEAGKKSGAEAADREVYIQRNLVSRASFVGQGVHAAAEWYLKVLVEGRRVDPEGIVARATREARLALERSASGLYRGDPKGFRGFAEDYYGEDLDRDGVVDEVRAVTESLLAHPVLTRLAAVPERIQEVERMSRMRLVGADLWVSPDVIVADEQGGLVIVDWKTGRQHHPDDVDGQLGVYALYTMKTYLDVDPERADELPLGKVRGLQAHARDGTHRTVQPSVADVDAALSAIRESASEMRNAERETSPMRPAGDPRCAKCPFRRTCER